MSVEITEKDLEHFNRIKVAAARIAVGGLEIRFNERRDLHEAVKGLCLYLTVTKQLDDLSLLSSCLISEGLAAFVSQVNNQAPANMTDEEVFFRAAQHITKYVLEILRDCYIATGRNAPEVNIATVDVTSDDLEEAPEGVTIN